MGIYAYGDNIVTTEYKESDNDSSKSIIYVPEEKSNTIKVKVASSNDTDIKVNDILVVDRRDVNEVTADSIKYLVVNKKHILAFVTE